MDKNDIYTPLGEAEMEIKRRFKDENLKKKLDDFWKENKPDFICEDSPRSVLSKSIISPNLEFKYFLDISAEIGLERSLWEYHTGKFVGKNQEKRHLGKLFFCYEHGKKHGHKIEHLNIVNFNKEEGKMIKDVKTLCKRKMVDFHHELLNMHLPKHNLEIHDISEWFNKTRNMDDYYVYYLSLFIRNNILFENFLFTEKEESKFTLNKFLPSFEKVTKMFGVKPIIVPLLPQENEKSNLWFSYDEKMQKNVKSMLG